MKSLNRKLIWLLSLLTVVSLCLGAVFFVNEDSSVYAKAAEAEFAIEIKPSYHLQDEFTVLDSIDVQYEDQTYRATGGTLVYPNGVAYGAGTYKLTQTGKYLLSYAFTAPKGKMIAEKEFYVVAGSYYVGLEASSTAYEKFKFGAMKEEKEGITVTLAEGDTFRYSRPLDLNELNMQELLKIYAENTHRKVVEKSDGAGGTYIEDQFNAAYLIVKFTDCYDPSNYIEMKINYYASVSSKTGKDQGFTYYRAGASCQDDVGLVYSKSQNVTGNFMKEVFIDGNRAVAQYGAYGTWSSNNQLGASVAFRYDVDSKRVYFQDALNSQSKEQMVCDLDNEDIYDDDLFGGFTTGEVYLSISASDYEDQTITFHIESIGGMKGDALIDADYYDTTSPVIEVDYQPTDESGVYAVKGSEFQLFDAKAYDVNLTGEVKSLVYYGTPKENPRFVTVKDGAFIPNAIGRYTIVYYAYDLYGNLGMSEVAVQCFDGEENITLEAEKLTSLQSGILTTLPEYSAHGVNGEVSVTVNIINLTTNEKATIGEDGKFLPWGAGEYEIVYTCKDNVFTMEESYRVTCVSSEKILFVDELNLPRYFIKGASYSLEKIFAYDFSSDVPVQVQSDYFVRFDGESEWTAFDNKNLKIQAENTVQIKAEKEDACVVSEVLPVLDVNFPNSKVKLEEYFQGNFSAEITLSDVTFTSNVTEGENKMEYINAVSASNFALEFSVPQGYANFAELEIVVTDYSDRNNKTVINITNGSGGEVSYVSVNGARPIELTKSISDGNSTFYYENGKLRSNSGLILDYDFGFKRDYCLVDVCLKGINGDAAIAVRKVNNQLFQKNLNNLPPQLAFTSSAGRTDIGSVVQIYPAQGTDALFPVLFENITVSVMTPDGGYATSEEGVLLDGTCTASVGYTLKLDEYGDYIVTYFAKDPFNRMSFSSYLIAVVDRIAPAIVFNNIKDRDTVSAKAYTIHKIESYKTSDNLPGDLSVSIFVFDPVGGILVCENPNEVNLGVKGVYTVMIRCMDSSGNYTVATYYVRAE